MTRARQLLMNCSEAFDRSRSCRFIKDASSGQLDSQVWQSYIAHELRFVCTVQGLMGELIVAAPRHRIEDWRGIIADLRDVQLPYLAGLLNLSAKEVSGLKSDDILSGHVTKIVGAGGYPAFASSMFAAENLYQQWCYTAWKQHRTTRFPALHDWIGMHVNSDFHRSVSFWNESVNEIDDRIQDRRLETWCNGMLEAESDFHDSAYGPGSSRSWMR
ncbi:MAG: hypothetical protein ABF747_07245 [Bifidobacterium sp.]|uniref:Thiaminase-2/PQQC domain-containing protein n=1 Tax=Bifidobacterium fermentum TaxID=3059035 RepID=A0AB39UPD6_9BIFI